jgi:hypothetical protein
MGTSYIVRYSSDGPDYYSTADFNGEIEMDVRGNISGGDDLYYWRVVLLRLCATAINNLMK